MKDSASVFSLNLPAEALPWPILAILLVGSFALAFYALKKAKGLKSYLGDPPFPTQVAIVIGGLIAFLGFVLVAICRLALGMLFPEGYEGVEYLISLALGVGGAIGIGKHAFSAEREEAKTKAALAVAAVAPPPASPAQVNVASGSEVKVQTTAQPAAPAARVPAMPEAGVAPSNPEVKLGLEQLSTKVSAFGGDSNE